MGDLSLGHDTASAWLFSISCLELFEVKRSGSVVLTHEDTMASNFKLGTAAMTAMCDALVDQIDAGAGAGTVKIFTGAPPATPATADSGTLLGTLTHSDPAFGNATAASPSVATASAITSDTSADASGDAGYFRIKDSNALVVMQGTAGNAGDAADMTFDNKTIVAGGTIAITSMTVSVPTQ